MDKTKATIIPAHDWRVFTEGTEGEPEHELIIAWMIDTTGRVTPITPGGPVENWRYLEGPDGWKINKRRIQAD